MPDSYDPYTLRNRTPPPAKPDYTLSASPEPVKYFSASLLDSPRPRVSVAPHQLTQPAAVSRTTIDLAAAELTALASVATALPPAVALPKKQAGAPSGRVSTWITNHPLRIRRRTYPCWMLMAVLVHPGLAGMDELTTMTAAQHLDAAQNGVQAKSISETFRSLLVQREVEYGLVVPSGHFVSFRTDYLITKTQLDCQMFYGIRQKNKRGALLSLFGQTFEDCEGVYGSPAAWILQTRTDWFVRTAIAAGQNTKADLDKLRIKDHMDRVPGNAVKSGFALSFKATMIFARHIGLLLHETEDTILMAGVPAVVEPDKNGFMGPLKAANSELTEKHAGIEHNKKRKRSAGENALPAVSAEPKAKRASTPPATQSLYPPDLFMDELLAGETMAAKKLVVVDDGARAVENLEEVLRSGDATSLPIADWMLDLCKPNAVPDYTKKVPAPPALPARVKLN